MLGDIRHPQLVAGPTGELAIDEVHRYRVRSLDARALTSSHEASQAGAAHDECHLVQAHVHSSAERELGINADSAVGLAEC